MLVEEHLDPVFIGGTHGGGGDGDLVAVGIVAGLSGGLDAATGVGEGGGDGVVEDAELGEVGRGEDVVGEVGEAAVALVGVGSF